MRWSFPGGPGGAEIAVSEARPRDALPLLALQRDVLEEREYFITLPHELTTTLEQKTQLIEELRASENSVLLVARRRQVVGAVMIVGGPLQRMRHVGKLEILVDPRHRGAGVGRALMTAAIAWAEANPILRKIGLSVFTTNTRAIALYRAFGFAEEGHRRDEYQMEDGTFRDDLLMFRKV